MKVFLKNIASVVLLLAMGSCGGQEIPSVDQLLSQRDTIAEASSDDFRLNDIRFSDDYKYMDLHLLLVNNVGPHDLSDSKNVKVSVKQTTRLPAGTELDDPLPPVLVDVVNVANNCAAADF